MKPHSPSLVLGLWAAQEASGTQEENQDFSIVISFLECELYPKDSPEMESGGVILGRSFLLTIPRLWWVWKWGEGKRSAFPGRAHCLRASPLLPGPTLRNDHDGRPTHAADASPSETPPWRQPLSPHTSAVLPITEEMSGLGIREKAPFACPALGHQLKALSLGHGGFVE